MEQLGYDVTVEEVAERLAMRGNQLQVFVASNKQSGVAGWVAVTLAVRFVGGMRSEIEGFIVDESARGQGIGERLLRQAEEWARERGCIRVRLNSNVIRERAHAFYERNGYTKLKAQFALEKTL